MLNCFFSLRSYLMEHTVNDRLFRLPQRVAHTEYGNHVDRGVIMWNQGGDSLTPSVLYTQGEG